MKNGLRDGTRGLRGDCFLWGTFGLRAWYSGVGIAGRISRDILESDDTTIGV